VRPDRVVVLAPLLDDDGGFLQIVEDLSIEQFIAQFSVEGFAVTVLPRASGCDVERLRSELCKPAAHDLCCHLRAVVRANVFGHASGEHHISHRLDDAKAVDSASHPDRKALPSELVDQRHQSELSPVMGLRLDEVIAPHMIAMPRPQPDTRSVVQPKPPAWSLLSGYF